MKILLAAFVISAALAALKVWQRWHADQQCPEMTAAAQVLSIEKRQTRPRHGQLDAYYCGVFETEDGRRVEFRLGSKMLRRLHPGDRGSLCWRGTRLIDFR